MKKEMIVKKIEEALSDLYLKEADLIKNETEEETISAHLMCYLKPHFDGWSVDLEYNRDGRKTKENINRDRIFPDIIIHHRTLDREERNSPENNLVAIEVKGYWNKEDRIIDEGKLRDMKGRYGYQYLFRIELEKTEGKVILV